MKKYALLSVLISSLLTMLFLGGCSKNSPTEPDNTEINELDKAYGGYSTSDELPAFGDATLSTEFVDDDNVSDPIVIDENFVAAVDSNTVNAYFIRIVWGMLEYDSTATEAIDWSGTATVDKGVLGIMKAIHFEGGDQIILPRPDRKVVQWGSHTTTHLDGISLVILDRDSTDSKGQFTFSTNLYSRTFTYDELDSLELVETVTESGHQVSIMAYKKEVIPFGGGFFDGRWIKTRKNGGKFYGRWINRLGTRSGHLKGIWGINRNDLKVFHGKYVTLNGKFGGLLSGLWGYVENDSTKGWLSGRWVNRNLTTIGKLKGHWKIKEDNNRRGFFHGKWKKTRP